MMQVVHDGVALFLLGPGKSNERQNREGGGKEGAKKNGELFKRRKAVVIKFIIFSLTYGARAQATFWTCVSSSSTHTLGWLR